MSEPLFYMQDSRTNCGSNAMFWGAKGGYATNLDALEVFTLEDAQRQHNARESDVPLLKSAVDALSIAAVDFQYLPDAVALVWHDGEYVIQKKGLFNGNDIAFIRMGGHTFNYAEAQVFSQGDVVKLHKDLGGIDVLEKSAVDNVARRTFQVENINKRKMISGAGIKFHKPKRVRPTTGKTRGNCLCCGKIVWSYNPYEAPYCAECR
jgi:ketosteroid isomerase-like protein